MVDRARPRARPDASTADPFRQPAAPAEPVDVQARSRGDEDAAAAARARYRVEPMKCLEPDAAIAPLLSPGERLLAVRRGAVFDRRQPRPGAVGPGLTGDVYLTSRRLLCLGRLKLTFGLDEIQEAVHSGDRLLLVMQDGAGIALEVDRPRLLRVEIATARAAARR
jgi:hypothetical protein